MYSLLTKLLKDFRLSNRFSCSESFEFECEHGKMSSTNFHVFTRNLVHVIAVTYTIQAQYLLVVQRYKIIQDFANAMMNCYETWHGSSCSSTEGTCKVIGQLYPLVVKRYNCSFPCRQVGSGRQDPDMMILEVSMCFMPS